LKEKCPIFITKPMSKNGSVVIKWGVSQENGVTYPHCLRFGTSHLFETILEHALITLYSQDYRMYANIIFYCNKMHVKFSKYLGLN